MILAGGVLVYFGTNIDDTNLVYLGSTEIVSLVVTFFGFWIGTLGIMRLFSHLFMTV